MECPEIIFLGTGSAFPKHNYHSCYYITDTGFSILVDTGGGNGILQQLENAGVDIEAIDNLFLTHAHADHILGAIWLIRAINKASDDGNYHGCLNIFANTSTLQSFDTICKLTLLPRHYKQMRKLTEYVDVEKYPFQKIGNREVKFFDVGSENTRQTGFKTLLSNGSTLVITGDEALTENNKESVRNADLVICGAFCRFSDADIFKPYEKHHYTVRDVAKIAQSANVGTLVIVHCEDTDVSNRQRKYADEAAQWFTGRVIVPNDLERLIFEDKTDCRRDSEGIA